MMLPLLLLGHALAFGDVSAAPTQALRGSRALSDTDYSVPSFAVDYSACSATPQTGSGFVTFYESGVSSAGGRVVSTQAYKNIERITFDLDLSGMPSSRQYGAFKVPSIYLISSANQPIGSTNYCDQGGNNCGSDCLEIDLFEGNGGLLGQTTIHSGESGGSDGCGNKQAWQIWSSDPAWTDILSNGCSGSKPSGDGVVDLTWSPSDTASVTVDFSSTQMTMTLTHGSTNATIFDSTATMVKGSNTVDFSKVATANSDTGFWILASWWYSESWIPGSSADSLTYDSSTCSGCDWLCDCSNGWGISNVKVYTRATAV